MTRLTEIEQIGSSYVDRLEDAGVETVEALLAACRTAAGRIELLVREALDVADDPALTTDFFMSREVFRAIKGISDPDGLYDRIVRMFQNDIHTLHGQVPADAQFVRFEFSTRRGWVGLREESNRLPYWAQRHNHIVYQSGGAEGRIEVRTMIAWDERWYITHLSEFRH